MSKQQEAANPHDGHRSRLKKRVREQGFTQLEDHEALELLLFSSIPRADTNALAHRLITRFGSLGGVFGASLAELQSVEGVGESTAIMLATAGELFTRTARESSVRYGTMREKSHLTAAVSRLFLNEGQEKLYLLCFDESMHLKDTLCIAAGDGSHVQFDQKKILAKMIETNATVGVLAHNHPGGTSDPSVADIDATRAVAVLLRKLGLSLADHIICGDDGGVYSMYADSRFTRFFY